MWKAAKIKTVFFFMTHNKNTTESFLYLSALACLSLKEIWPGSSIPFVALFTKGHGCYIDDTVIKSDPATMSCKKQTIRLMACFHSPAAAVQSFTTADGLTDFHFNEFLCVFAFQEDEVQ